jgi:hypothetical protein
VSDPVPDYVQAIKNHGVKFWTITLFKDS